MISKREDSSRFGLEKKLLLSQFIFGGLLLLILLSSVMVPIYSDEIALKLVKTDVWLADFNLRSLFPQCSLSYEYVPASLLPGAMVYSVIYSSNDPIILRLIGVFIVFLWLSVIWAISNKIFGSNLDKTKTIYLALVAVCSLGVAPFIYVLFRPEAIMLLGILILIWTSLNLTDITKNSRLVRFVAMAVFLTISSLVFYAHPKALFYAPLILFLSSYFYRAGGKIEAYLLGSGVLILAYQTYLLASAAKCKESAFVTNLVKNNVSDLPDDFFGLISQLISNVYLAIINMSSHASFNHKYQSNWLPKDEDITLFQKLVGDINEWVIILLLFGLLWLFVTKVFNFIICKNIKRSEVVACLVMVAIVGQLSLFNPSKMHFYNLGLIVPLAIVSVIFLSETFINKISVRTVNVISLPVMLLGITSLLVLTSHAAYPLYNLNFNDKRLEITKAQPLSAKTVLDDGQLESLKDLAKKCELPLHNANRLIVDGVSFRIFNQLKEPVLIFYAQSYGKGDELEPIFGQFFKKYDSDGVIAACRFIPESMRERVVEIDGMCCISKENLY
jgi:hypothetical protein